MKSRTATFLISIALTSCHTDVPTARVKDQIDRSVIAYAASTLSAVAVETCIDAQIRGQNLQHQRKILEDFSSEGENYLRASEMISEGLDLAWFLPEKAGHKLLKAPPTLLTQLQSATAEALKSKLETAYSKRYIKVSAVPKTIKYVRNPVLIEGAKSVSGRNCPAIFSINEPAISGDIALVETSYVCGGLCGGGQILALRRGNSGWDVVAIAPTWVS